MNRLAIVVLVALVLAACKTPQTAANGEETINLDTFTVSAVPKRPAYNPSHSKALDLVHTQLEVKFDWKKQHLLGEAQISLTPHFYSTSKAVLDAKGFDIHQLSLKEKDTLLPLSYTYDSLQLFIDLGKEFSRKDTFMLFIDYTAKPNERESGGSAAITSDKGLYFINPLGEDPDKHMEIWTQGETEASSCWFPTIDKPNQKTTQDIYITVNEKYTTLSNGELVFSTENGDGTRTDYWRMIHPHAPYLFMMGIGEFAVVKDKWRDMEVSYYVESEWEKYARSIFGATPEMIEFFSKRMGVDYPWHKYSQIVVRDYVSGAMENTTAVIHGEFLYRTDRELLDSDNEDIIAHELFHHWFGDLVTCESWANLPLNESFATYGEYLWREYKHGLDAADHALQNDLSTYLAESRMKQEDLIRYGYEHREEMFDGHSYAKGGRILHMLRNVVGDDAFFESLRVYLTDNAYTAAEIHDLRRAFEKTIGEDMNWFFDQWFMSSGHPELLISYEYYPTSKTQEVTIEQKQNFDKTPIYRMPVAIDIYAGGKVQREEVWIDAATNVFRFEVPAKPDLVNVDAKKMLLCRKKDTKKIAEWAFQYRNAPLYLDRYEAIDKCGDYSRKDSVCARIVLEALNDKYYNNQVLAMGNLKYAQQEYPDEVKYRLLGLANKAENTRVRSTAMKHLAKYYPNDEDLMVLYKKALKDSSYNVLSEGLEAISKSDPKEALAAAKQFENEKSNRILSKVASIYAANGDDSHNAFFQKAYKRVSGFGRIGFIKNYEEYLKNGRSSDVVESGLPLFEDVAMNGGAFWIKIYGFQGLESLGEMYRNQEHKLNEKITELEAAGGAQSDIAALQQEQNTAKQMNSKISASIDHIKAAETDERLLKMYNN